MTRLILHHYDTSPFGEKVRLAFGYKQLSWSAVEMPTQPPRPDTIALTGGYRRSPVLQIGADVFCDTSLILAELERRFPDFSLYPHGLSGHAVALAEWADRAGFLPSVRLTMALIGDILPPEFIADRKLFMSIDFSKAASLADLPANRQRVTVLANTITQMLVDGRSYLLGDTPSVADLSAYHPFWFIKTLGGDAAMSLVPMAPLLSWIDRIASIGHGERSELSSREAVAIACDAKPDPVNDPIDDIAGVKVGERAIVFAAEPNDPVYGELVTADQHQIVISHTSTDAGIVNVHFPRANYILRADER